LYLKARELSNALLLFKSIPFYTILTIGRYCLHVKVLACYIDPNGIENKMKTVEYTYPTGIKKCDILIIDI
jgi:hypothetical protein